MAENTVRRRLGALLLASGATLGVAACQTTVDDAPATAPSTSTASEEPGASATATSAPTGSPAPTPTAGATNGVNVLTAPLDGSTVAGPTVTVSGQGTAFEATLSYRVLVAGSQDVVAEGFTMAGANGEVGPFSFDVDLTPGSYTVQVWEPDMSDGEGTLGTFGNLVEATFTVS